VARIRLKEINAMNFLRLSVQIVLFSSLWLGVCAVGQETTPSPDNTRVNQRDRNSSEPTADQQKNAKSDRDMTRKIRQALVQDKSLSTYGHNVKIVTQHGVVTLKGPVRSEDEKKAVETEAAEMAGENNVTSNLDVKPKI
jgi:hyperosmotically inducible protein